MKRIGTLSVLILLAVSLISPAVLAKEEITVSMTQTQFQWRTWDEDGWTWISYDYVAEPWVFERSGNVLHTVISYQPAVSEEEGTSMVYVYDKKEECWILHEGTINYVSPYSGLWITEYWKGYLEFNEEGFDHGVGYQWGYVYNVDWETVEETYPYAIWDETMGAWLLGFSIYLWDPIGCDQEAKYKGEVLFPDPFIEPVPKRNYNPEGL